MGAIPAAAPLSRAGRTRDMFLAHARSSLVAKVTRGFVVYCSCKRTRSRGQGELLELLRTVAQYHNASSGFGPASLRLNGLGASLEDWSGPRLRRVRGAPARRSLVGTGADFRLGLCRADRVECRESFHSKDKRTAELTYSLRLQLYNFYRTIST